MENGYGMEDICLGLEALLGRPVVPVRDALPPDDAPSEFMKRMRCGFTAAYVDGAGAVRVHVNAARGGDRMAVDVIGQVLYHVCRAFGPQEALLRDPVKARGLRLAEPSAPHDAQGLAAACLPPGSRIPSRLLSASGVPVLSRRLGVDDTAALVKAVAAGVRAWRGSLLARAVEEGDAKVLSREAVLAAEGVSGAHKVHFGVARGPWLDMGYPAADIVCGTESLRRQAAAGGVTARSLALEGALAAAVQRPMAVLRRPEGGGMQLVTPLRNASGEFITAFVQSPQEAARAAGDREGEIRITGFGALSAPRLAAALGRRDRDTGESAIAYLSRRGDGSRVWEVTPELRDAMDAYRKTRPGLRADFADTATPGSLTYGAKIVDSGQTSKFISRRWDDAALGAAMASCSRALEAHRNPHDFSRLDRELFGSPAPAPVPAPAQEPPRPAEEARPVPEAPSRPRSLQARLSERLTERNFRPAFLRKLPPGVRDAGSLLAHVRSLGEEGFRRAYGPKALKESYSFLSSLALSSMTVTRHHAVAAGLSPVEAADADLLYRLREMPRSLAPGTAAMPVDRTGAVIGGADAYHLVAAVAGTPAWCGCNVFLTAAECGELGLRPLPSARAIHLRRGDVYCLAEMDMPPRTLAHAVQQALDAAVAVPAPMLNQLASYGVPRDRDTAHAYAGRFEAFYADVVAPALKTPRPCPMEDTLMRALRRARKDLDREAMDCLRDRGVPASVIDGVLLRGSAAFDGEVRGRGRGSRPVRVSCTFALDGGRLTVDRHDGRPAVGVMEAFGPDAPPLRQMKPR